MSVRNPKELLEAIAAKETGFKLLEEGDCLTLEYSPADFDATDLRRETPAMVIRCRRADCEDAYSGVAVALVEALSGSGYGCETFRKSCGLPAAKSYEELELKLQLEGV